MTISKTAIEEFRTRELDDLSPIKKISSRQAWADIKDLGLKDYIVTKPFKHQKICTLLTAHNPSLMLFLHMGSGKTKIGLDTIRIHKEEHGARKALVLVPNLVNIDNWVEETAVHQPSLRTVPLIGSSAQRWTQRATEGDIYVINYTGLGAMCSELVTVRGRKSRKRKLQRKLMDKFLKEIDTVIYDESTDFKNSNSLNFQVCSYVSSKAQFRYGLTGTPFGRDPEDLWAQFYVIDFGETLGPNLTIFREAYFNKKLIRMGKRYFNEWSVSAKGKKLLSRAIKHHSIRFSESECQDLPKAVYSKLRVALPMEAETYYKEMKKQINNSGGDYKEVESAFLRMRQISSGFVGFRNEDNERVEICFKQNPKMDALEQLVNQIIREGDEKIIIFNEYIFSGLLIRQMLERNKINCERIYSGTKDKIGVIRKFKKDTRTRVLVGNSSSMDKGLNLQVAKYCIFYESPVSPIVRAQCEARIRRGKPKTGGHKSRRKDHVYYYDLVTKGTVDEQILAMLQEGKDLFKQIIGGAKVK